MQRILVGFVAAIWLTACGALGVPPEGEADVLRKDDINRVKPIIIAHRGASGHLPEHTLEAYQLAIEQGADFIEPDLVMTKDGILVARHDRYLSTSTNVADHPEFSDRKRIQSDIYGTREDWWAEDFTLAELKTLRARQTFPGRSRDHDDLYSIPTFSEVLDLVSGAAGNGRPVGIYPETKAPSHHEAIGLSMTGPLLRALQAARLRERSVPVFIQSFEADILRDLARESDWPLIQLVSGDPRAEAAGHEPPIEAIEAAGIGVNKALLWRADGMPSNLVADAKARGLKVHVWTLRDDRVGAGFASIDDELAAIFALGVDGVFTDFPRTALANRGRY